MSLGLENKSSNRQERIARSPKRIGSKVRGVGVSLSCYVGGTIGFAGVGDDFWLAVRVVGEEVSLFLSDLTAAADYPLARQVLKALDIPIPADDELDQVLPVGDMSIFADLGLEEMELGAVAADLDLYPEDAVAGIAERLRFGEAVEQALDRALGS